MKCELCKEREWKITFVLQHLGYNNTQVCEECSMAVYVFLELLSDKVWEEQINGMGFY